MYQRFSMARVSRRSLRPSLLPGSRSAWELLTGSKDELHHPEDDLVGDHEEDRCQGHHDEHHGRRDPDLFPGRPRDFRYFLSDLLDKDERVLHLKTIAAITSLISEKGFERKWLEAESIASLKTLLVVNKRMRYF